MKKKLVLSPLQTSQFINVYKYDMLALICMIYAVKHVTSFKKL